MKTMMVITVWGPEAGDAGYAHPNGMTMFHGAPARYSAIAEVAHANSDGPCGNGHGDDAATAVQRAIRSLGERCVEEARAAVMRRADADKS